MKKIILCAVALLMVAGCFKKDNDSFMGQKYMAMGANETAITLAFSPDEPRVFGKVVNNYNGSYTVDGTSIKFGPMATTMMMGPQEAMEDEQSFHQFMSKVNGFKFDQKNLILSTEDGQTMIFEYQGEADMK